MAVAGEGDPAGLIAERDAGHLARGDDCVVEDVELLIVAVAEPEFFFIGREGGAVGLRERSRDDAIGLSIYRLQRQSQTGG